MRRLIFILFPILFAACNHSSQINGRSLNDTLETLKKLSDFKPLNQADAYDFINQYYLPRLDTLPTKRKIFLYPLNGVDFREAYNRDKAKLEKEYSGDTTIKTQSVVFAPPSIFFNKQVKWDGKRFLNTKVIADTAILINNGSELRDFNGWHHKYGWGYMCISYPQYNAHTKRLLIREWVEDGDWICGTGRGRNFWFTRIPGGWKAN